jgi:hypothetical protein
MNKYVIASLLLAASYSHSSAQDNKQFASFARTKDSLMHIAYYDKDIPKYKKYMGEFLVAYNKQNAKDKAAFKDYLQDQYYNLACAYAKAGDKKHALDNLELSKMYDYEHLSTDPDLASLHKEPRFIKYMEVAKKVTKNKKSDYQLTLQKDAKYNEAEQTSLPDFTYEAATDPNLVALKTAFNLDSIAGEGTDVSKIINLMEWVHYLIPHDGSKGNPEVKNAMSLITECRRDKRSLNCRGLAILLNEVYLAEGFKSRFVTCLPKNIADNDCHVITMVWSTSLNKWLWMDPTFMAYVMNEDGELLSIEEVRDRLVHNKPIILNPDANRNHATTQTKSDYLGYYMSKNLYKLECPIASEYNYETYAEGKARKYIALVPGTVAPKAEIKKDKNGAEVYATYYTNNPKYFWAAPPAVEATERVKAEGGHTQAEYEQVVAKFKDCYNRTDGKCVDEIMTADSKGWLNDKELKRLVEKYGKMTSFKYIGMEGDNEYEDVALFKVVCEHSTHCLAISLSEPGKMGTFRFHTTSTYIDWAMAKEIDKENSGK